MLMFASSCTALVQLFVAMVLVTKALRLQPVWSKVLPIEAAAGRTKQEG